MTGNRSEDDKLNLATIFLILSPFIGIMIGFFIVALLA